MGFGVSLADRFQERRSAQREFSKQISQRGGRFGFAISRMHSGNSGQLRFEMPDRLLVGIMTDPEKQTPGVTVRKFRFAVIPFGTKLDQLHKIGGRLVRG